MSDYQLQSLGTAIKITNDHMHKSMTEAFEATRDQMLINLYGDIPPRKPLTKKQRILRQVKLCGSRVHDAWLVLTGKVDLYDGY